MGTGLARRRGHRAQKCQDSQARACDRAELSVWLLWGLTGGYENGGVGWGVVRDISWEPAHQVEEAELHPEKTGKKKQDVVTVIQGCSCTGPMHALSVRDHLQEGGILRSKMLSPAMVIVSLLHLW